MRIFLKRTAVAGFVLFLGVGKASAANPEWDQATQLYSTGNYKAALGAFQKIAEKMPRDPSVHYMLGQCYKGLYNSKQAISELDWVSKYATDPRIKNGAASLLSQLKGGGSGSVISGATIPGAVSPYSKMQEESHKAAVSTAKAVAATPPSKDLINDSVSQTIAAAAAKGWVPCRNPECLTYAKNGWHHEHVEGFKDSDQWMEFSNDTGKQLFSWRHVGDIIKDLKDTGPCPKCNGSGWNPK